MQDEYAGQAGTFIVDGEAGIRVPAEQWEAYLAAKPQVDGAEQSLEEHDNATSHA